MTGAFDDLMAEVMAKATRFGHRQHIHLAWLAIRRYGTDEATKLVNEGIKKTVRYVGAPQKYHETISRAWMRLVAHHIARDHVANFSAFASRYPQLLDKRLLTRHYRPATLSNAVSAKFGASTEVFYFGTMTYESMFERRPRPAPDHVPSDSTRPHCCCAGQV